jgi:hypothetical protein
MQKGIVHHTAMMPSKMQPIQEEKMRQLDRRQEIETTFQMRRKDLTKTVSAAAICRNSAISFGKSAP